MKKIKYTIYLSQSTLDLLDGIWIELRATTKSRQITKSLILETALEVASREWQEHGKDANLFDAIITKIAAKIDDPNDPVSQFWNQE